MGKGKVELLAPAGNYESFLGAINAGADAVYLGGEKFGARAYADNFSEEEICRAISYAHVFGRKVYLTVNTLIKDSELPELVPYITPFYEAGLDGVIVQDLGALLTIREAFPGLELHASTQMTLTGSFGVDFLKELGVVRIVPARELSLQEMMQIKEQTGLEVEAFVHGAMCYCYSGQCLFSSILGGRSGNRGRCAQPCRLPYQICGVGNTTKSGQQAKHSNIDKEEYPLSLKDMCTIELIPKLIEAGINSFKIEGRMKKPEYAAGVTAIYRKYIDLYYEKGATGYKVAKEDLEKLSSLYIRSQIQEGYYFKHNGADMVTLQSPAYNGSDEKLLHFIRENYINSPVKQKVQMQATFKVGKESKLTVCCMDKQVTVSGQVVELATKQPVTRENVLGGLLKLGNTPFSAESKDIEVEMDDNIFFPLKSINDLRRSAIEELVVQFCGYERKMTETTRTARGPGNNSDIHADVQADVKTDIQTDTRTTPGNYRVLVSTKEQMEAYFKSGLPAQVLYLESLLLKASMLLQNCKERLRQNSTSTKIMIALPYIVRKQDYQKLDKMLPYLEQADGVLVRNLESLQWLHKKNYKKEIVTDAGIYCFNNPTLSFWQKEADGCCLPYELNKKELRKLLAGCDERKTEQIAYGRIPLMITANCVAKTSGACFLAKSGKEAVKTTVNTDLQNIIYLKDRYRKDFPVLPVCEHCYNVIYNAVPLFLHEKIQNSGYAGAWRLAFTVENEKETMEILKYFINLQKGIAAKPPVNEYTLGHEKRGVE